MEYSSPSLKKRVVNALLILLGILAVLAALVFVGKLQDKAQEAGTGEVLPTDHVAGNPDGMVTLIEYSDFQCPACRAYSPVMDRLITDYADSVRFVYRHFPIYSKHPNAEMAARAAEAADEQGQFFAYATFLFEHQDEWAALPDPREKFADYAAIVGLDVDSFTLFMNSAESRKIVSQQYKSGLALGVNSTPTFFFNGEKIESPSGYEAFKTLLDEALTAAQTSVPSPSPTEADSE